MRNTSSNLAARPTLRSLAVRLNWGNGKLFSYASLAAVSAVILFLVVYGLSAKHIVMVVDGQQQTLVTHQGDLAHLLSAQGVVVNGHDQISVPLNAKLKSGERIVIRHTLPVTVEADGKTVNIYTAADTVGDALKDNHIVLGKDDEVYPSLDTALQPDTTIRVVRVNKVIAQVKDSIPYQTVEKKDGHLAEGKKEVKQSGKEGVTVKTVEKVYRDGQLASEQVISSDVKTPSVNKIVEVGTRKPVTVLSASSPDVDTVTVDGHTFSYKKELTNCILTAYDAGIESTGKTPKSPEYGITYTGTHVEQGRTVAVDPKVIPLGWWIYIDGIGFRHAEDIGSGVRGKWIDIYYDSHAFTTRFGLRRGAKVYVIGPNKPAAVPR